MYPHLVFSTKHDSLIKQTRNLETQWKRDGDTILENINYFVNIPWKIDKITVTLFPTKSDADSLNGEMDEKEPETIYLYVPAKNRWTPRRVGVLIHELVHSNVHSDKDSRHNEPNIVEFWIMDELATDLITEHIMKEVYGAKPNYKNVIEYALKDTSQRILKNKELLADMVKNMNSIFKEYRKNGSKYNSLRKKMLQI